MKTRLRLSAVAFYILSFGVLVWYCGCSFIAVSTLTPIARLMSLAGICVLAYLGSFLLIRTTEDSAAKKIMKATFAYWFLLYVMLLVTLVLFDSYFGRVGFGNTDRWSTERFWMYFQNSFNIIPFRTICAFIWGFFESTFTLGTVVTNLLGNLVAFSPFAFFLPLLFRRIQKFLPFLLVMTGIVVVVEISQMLLLTGFCDIDDLILNVGGACLFYGLLHIGTVKRIIAKFTKLEY